MAVDRTLLDRQMLGVQTTLLVVLLLIPFQTLFIVLLRDPI